MFESTKVRVETTRDPADGERYFGYWDVLDYAWDAADPVIRIPASAANPILVKEVAHIITTAFTATATVDVGDGTDGDFWIDTTDMTVDALGDSTSSLTAAAAHPGGVVYTSNVAVKVTVAGTVSAGAGKLMVHAIRL